MQAINLGSTQAPYWEQTITLKPNEHRKIDYVADSFQLQKVSTENALHVSFGGTMIQTPFSAGMGYKLTEPVQFIEFWNKSAASLTIQFVLAIGDIKDNRLTVSGVVNTRIVSNSGFKSVTGGTSTDVQTLKLTPCQFDLMVTSGNATINVTSDNGEYSISGLIIPEGGSWNIQLALDSTVTVTPSESGVYNYTIGKY